jgi:hypothetical protein
MDEVDRAGSWRSRATPGAVAGCASGPRKGMAGRNGRSRDTQGSGKCRGRQEPRATGIQLPEHKKTPQGMPAAFLSYFTASGLLILWLRRNRVRLGLDSR